MGENILIIENQELQFNNIFKMLEDYHTPFPKNDKDYHYVISRVKICVDPRYDVNPNTLRPDSSRRDNALNDIIKFIEQNKIKLILMDYILAGYLEGEKGTDLAKKIRLKNSDVQFIFLSRTEKNNPEVQRELNSIGFVNPMWIEKGFAGKGLGDKSYFLENILPKINEVLQYKDINKYNPKANEILKSLATRKSFKRISHKIVELIHTHTDFDENKTNLLILINKQHVTFTSEQLLNKLSSICKMEN